MNITFLNNISICNAWNWVEKYLGSLAVQLDPFLFFQYEHGTLRMNVRGKIMQCLVGGIWTSTFRPCPWLFFLLVIPANVYQFNCDSILNSEFNCLAEVNLQSKRQVRFEVFCEASNRYQTCIKRSPLGQRKSGCTRLATC